MQLNRRTIAGFLIAAATLAVAAPIAAGAAPSKKPAPVIVPGTPHAPAEMNAKARNQSAKLEWPAPTGGDTVHCYKARLFNMDGSFVTEVEADKLQPKMTAKLILPRENAGSLGDWYVVHVVSVGYTSIPAAGENPPCDGPESLPSDFAYVNLKYKK